MLQQILRDMYVDPEILAELPEEQKEMLFFKIREEQIRRYNEREKENNLKQAFKPKKITNKGKKVCILEDSRGNPWTWICGEFEGDISAEEKWQKLHEDKMESAIRSTVQEESNSLRGKSQPTRTKTIERNASKEKMVVKSKPTQSQPSSNPPNNCANIPASFAHRQVLPTSSPVVRRRELNATSNGNSIRNPLSRSTPVNSGSQQKQESLKVVIVRSRPTPEHHNLQRATNSPKADLGNSQSVAKLKREESLNKKNLSSTNEITSKNRENREKSNAPQFHGKENEENIYESFNQETKQEDGVVSNEEWMKQLRQFKEADKKRSIRARRASREYRRQSLLAADSEKLRVRFQQLAADNAPAVPEERTRPVIPPKPQTLRAKHPMIRPGKLSKPRNRKEIKEWFEETQLSTLTHHHNSLPGWFHGIITRTEAEDLLKHRNTGDYLIRVSDKYWGYALGYKDTDKIKHFLIDASENQCYHFFGNDQIRHDSLDDLIAYHKGETISYNNEMLKNYVGQRNLTKPDYEELLRDTSGTDTRL